MGRDYPGGRDYWEPPWRLAIIEPNTLNDEKKIISVSLFPFYLMWMLLKESTLKFILLSNSITSVCINSSCVSGVATGRRERC